MTGPDGSAWVETFHDPSNFPPYKNGPQQTQTYGLLADQGFWIYKIMPIATYGDYSLSLTNAGNTTINMVVETWSTEITINTSFLDENPDVTLFDPVRIREETKTYLKPLSIDAGLFLISVAILAVLSVYLVNAPLPKMGVFSSSSHTQL